MHYALCSAFSALSLPLSCCNVIILANQAGLDWPGLLYVYSTYSGLLCSDLLYSLYPITHPIPSLLSPAMSYIQF